MTSCLPFMLLSSSIPLTLRSNISDPGFPDLAADQRSDSSLSESRLATVDVQPSRASSLSDTMQRGGRRTSSVQSRELPRSVPTLQRQRSRNSRITRAAPPVSDLAAIHEQWIGTRVRASNGHSSRVSHPGRNSSAMVKVDELPRSSRRSSDIPSARSSTSLPSIRLSLDSRFSIASTLAPSSPSPVLWAENRNSSSPPSPSLSTVEEDVVLRLPKPRRAVAALHTPGEDVEVVQQTSSSDSSSPPSPSLSVPDSDLSEASGSIPRRKTSTAKSVSFSKDVPQIILSADNILEDNRSLRRQSSWNGLFLLNMPPVAAKPPHTRRTSMRTVRGQAAGKSCLKRTSSFSDDLKVEVEKKDALPMPVTDLKPAPRTNIGHFRDSSSAPQLPMPSLYESHSIDIPNMLSPQPVSENSSARIGGEEEQAEPQARPGRVGTMVVALSPRKPEPSLSLEQKTVRHWSMTGNGLKRKSAIYDDGNARAPTAREAPPISRLPSNVDMLRT